MESLYRYMPADWAERFRLKGADISLRSMVRYAHPRGHLVRTDSTAPDGSAGGSDPQFTSKQLLDSWSIDIALLINIESGTLAAGLAGPDDAVTLSRAVNDFFLSEWTPSDARYRYAMVIPTENPPAAAAEIDRVGANPAVAAVFMPLQNSLMGSRQYDPIYRAAAKQSLPIVVHPTGMDFRYYSGPAPIGLPESYVERYINTSQIPAANLTNLIFTGAFERFPELRVIFIEYGFSWLLPLMWRMDKAWRGLRIETPWVRKSPSDYVHGHVRLSTQPIDEPVDDRHIGALIDMMGDDLLLFASDYPHWDNDDPRRTLTLLPADTRRRVFGLNAMQSLRITR